MAKCNNYQQLVEMQGGPRLSCRSRKWEHIKWSQCSISHMALNSFSLIYALLNCTQPISVLTHEINHLLIPGLSTLILINTKTIRMSNICFVFVQREIGSDADCSQNCGRPMSTTIWSKQPH